MKIVCLRIGILGVGESVKLRVAREYASKVAWGLVGGEGWGGVGGLGGASLLTEKERWKTSHKSVLDIEVNCHVFGIGNIGWG